MTEAQSEVTLPPAPLDGTTSSSSSGRESRERTKEKDRRRERSRSRDRRSSRGDGEKERSSRSHRRSRSKSRERSSKSSAPKAKSRSPSPIRWKKRRKSLWDKAPTGFDTDASLKPINTDKNAQSRQARRLYVGNLPPGTSDLEVAEFFNHAMSTSKVVKDDNPEPVIAVQMNPVQNFAFLEFTCTEDASAGMAFDGVAMKGYSLKIRRPKDYKPEYEINGIGQRLLMGGIISTNVEEGPNKIFIGGLPSYLTEEQVKELVAAFGQLKSFNLVKDSATGNSKGFAFFEYLEGEITDRACAGLNGMKLGEKTVLVQRANIGAKHQQPKGTGESVLCNPTALHFLNLGMPIAAATALLNININDPGSPTTVVQLINIVSPEDLGEEGDYDEILDDIREECKKYGTIESIYIPRPPKRGRDDDGNPTPIVEPMWGVGRVFIEFKRPEEAFKAQQDLGGRRFAGHTVISGFYPEDRYIRKDFLPDREEEMVFVEAFKKRQQEKEFARELESDEEDEEAH